MSIKEYLSQAVLLDMAINEAISELERTKELAMTSRSFIGTSNGSNSHSKVEEVVEKICRLEEKINSQIDRYVDTKEEIEVLIDKIPDIQQKTIMRYHYILGHTWERISDECYISIRNVHYMHNKAIEFLGGIMGKSA